MVTLLLPASSVSSTHTSCQDQAARSVVLFDKEKSGWVEAGGGSFHHAFDGLHDDAFTTGIARATIEHIQDGFFAAGNQHAAETLDGRQQCHEHLFARLRLA